MISEEVLKNLKKEIFWLDYGLKEIKEEFASMQSRFSDLCDILVNFNLQLSQINGSLKSISSTSGFNTSSVELTPAQVTIQQTKTAAIPATNPPFKPLRVENISFSTGNEGVPADRQTDQQTDKYPLFLDQPLSIKETNHILDSLDSLKKDLRAKFKRLTEQEFLVFSTIYQLEQEFGFCDYKVLSEKLSLTESSIRDYVGKLTKKEIPIIKTKLNNKSIQLTILPNFKRLAPLPLIVQLRGL